MERRTYLAGAGSGLAAATAGCGFILGTEAAKFSADPAVASDAAIQETGYERKAQENMKIEREFSAAGQSRKVVVTNVLTKYEKSIDLGPLGEQRGAVFTCLTTPQVDLFGKEFNPVQDWSAEKLAKMAQSRYSGFKNLSRQGESNVTINGNTTTQVKFVGEAMLAGSPVEIALHVCEAVALDGDFAVAFGAYPQQTSGEESNVLALMESIQRP